MRIEIVFLGLCVSLTAHAQSVLYAEKFAGADAGEKISRCIAALPSTGGICDARNFSGEQRASAGFTVGGTGKPVELMLGSITLNVSQGVHVQAKSSIVGMPSSSGIGSDQGATVIKAADNSGLRAVVQIEGALAVLQDLTIDGNKKAGHGSGETLRVERANRVQLFRVTVQNSPGDGIAIVSAGKQESCCAKLENVMAIANARAGLHIINSNDVFIVLSEFENNGGNGIEVESSSAMRLEQSDIGGNQAHGVNIHGSAAQPASNLIITGNQFGNNYQTDINISGSNGRYSSIGNTISSNQFLGGAYRASGKYDAVQIVDSAYNVIASNSFFANHANSYRFCVNISGGLKKPDQVINNFCQAAEAGGSGAFIGTSTTVFSGNQGETRTQASH